jgi:hypothetical protein
MSDMETEHSRLRETDAALARLSAEHLDLQANLGAEKEKLLTIIRALNAMIDAEQKRSLALMRKLERRSWWWGKRKS